MKAFSALVFLAASTATLAQTVPGTSGGYVFSELNAAGCPGGSSPLTSAADCETATLAMPDYAWTTFTVNYHDRPKGCYCGLTASGGKCYYNEHLTGGPSYSTSSSSGYFATCLDVTPSTTPAPTSAPWDLERTGVSADFGTPGTGQVEVTYRIGKGRLFAQRITEGSCDAEGPAVPVPEGVVSSTVGPPEDDVAYPLMQERTVQHQINMSALVGSNIFDAESNSLSFCQEAELKTAPADGDLVISQVRMDLNVTLNMTATFEANVTLAEGTVSEEDKTVDLEDQVDAYPCTSFEDYSRKVEAVAPNQVVHICVTTRSPDIEIETLDTMKAKGRADEDDEFTIIDRGAAVVDAITKTQNNATFHVVQTRLPINKVTYAAGNVVDIFGTLTLRLGGRRLAVAAAIPGRRLQVPQDAADGEAAGFSLDLALAPAEEDERAPVAVASAAAAGAVRAGVLVAAAAVAFMG